MRDFFQLSDSLRRSLGTPEQRHNVQCLPLATLRYGNVDAGGSQCLAARAREGGVALVLTRKHVHFV